MRPIRRFQPRLDSMPIRITPSDMLNPMAPVVLPYGPSEPPAPTNPMAPVVLPYTTISPIQYADT